ncbi:acyl carrier protein [Pseudoalteromonas sp. T1lg65]|uniref:acyl carrier protein n=1 Tax=Pseudoalteromonas sp. T1lg65 TaxID=2077101 RepID=UPI003F78D591
MQAELIAFFEHFLESRGVTVSDQQLLAFNFVQSGLLDSFEILSMVMQLETEFGVSLSPEELSAQQNATVKGLIDTLCQKP